MKRKKAAFIIVIITLIIFITAELTYNPSIRILASVINFSESTLKSPDYLAYGIDLKDLFRNYANADVEYSGSAYIKKLSGFPYSISGTINGQRSASQKQFSCKSNVDVLVLSVGQLEIYAKGNTVYLVAPMLGDIAYGFNTGEDLFPQAPNLSNDINREWFHNNKKNIYNFVRSIKIEKTDDIFVDDDGTKAYEYRITIPKGQGQFIWDLLGTDAPDHDIKTSLYLDKFNHTRKIVFDLSHKTKGEYVAIYGNNLGTLEIYSPLPEKEDFVATIKRNGNNKYTNSYTIAAVYTTSGGDKYTLNSGLLLNYTEDGVKAEGTDITIAKNKTSLAEGYMKGRIQTKENMGDVFENAGADLSGVQVIDWDTIKNDTASFVDDVISKARENVELIN